MAWTNLNEEASGYYQCLSVHRAGTGVSHPNGQVYIVRVYSNVTTEVEFVLKTSCGYLLADIPSLPSGSWFFWLVSPVCGVMPGNGRSA